LKILIHKHSYSRVCASHPHHFKQSTPGNASAGLSVSAPVLALSINCVHAFPPPMAQVFHLQPWFSKDLAIRPLQNRIHDLLELQTLYPATPKALVHGLKSVPEVCFVTLCVF